METSWESVLNVTLSSMLKEKRGYKCSRRSWLEVDLHLERCTSDSLGTGVYKECLFAKTWPRGLALGLSILKIISSTLDPGREGKGCFPARDFSCYIGNAEATWTSQSSTHIQQSCFLFGTSLCMAPEGLDSSGRTALRLTLKIVDKINEISWGIDANGCFFCWSGLGIVSPTPVHHLSAPPPPNLCRAVYWPVQ